MTRPTLILAFVLWVAALLCLRAQTPPAPEVIRASRPLVHTAGSKRGALDPARLARVATPRRPHTGWRIDWDYDPALREFVSFRAYARTNLSTNSEVLWGATTNTWFEFRTSPARPMMFMPRIVSVDVALPKMSDGGGK